MTVPAAQGAEAPVAPSEQQAVQQAQPDNSGIQTRINELTAARRSAEESAAALARQNQELTNALIASQERMSQAAQPQYAPPQPPASTGPPVPEGMDPATAVYFQSLVAAQTQQLAAQVQRMVQPLGVSVEEQQLEREIAAAGVDGATALRARQLLGTWRQRGMQGWVPGDAVAYAMGEAARKAVASGQRAAFNAGTPGMLPVGAPPQVEQVAQPAVPADIDSWAPEKQVEFWDKRVGDKPF